MRLRLVDIVNRTISLAGLRVVRNIPYGLHARQKLDVYVPASRGAGLLQNAVPVDPLPVIVFFYGGSWQCGHRADYRFAAAALAKQGFMVVVPDYRLHPEVKFPVFLQDCAASVGWVFKNIQSHGGDDKLVFLMGHSAGAYNAAMLALNTSYLGAQEIDAARLSGWIGLSGPYDFLPLGGTFARIFSAAEDANLTQPLHFVRQGAPPALLLHGGNDRVVLPRNTAILAAALREAGNAVETRIYPKLGHAGVLTACLPWYKWRARLMKDILMFTAACRSGEFADAGSDISAPMLR